MNGATQTRFPRIVRREHNAHQPTQSGYIKIAIFLAVVTLLEVAVYQVSLPSLLYMAILVALSAIKFGTVVAFFMHLRFDGRLLSYVFLCGLALAFIVFAVMIFSLHAIQVGA